MATYPHDYQSKKDTCIISIEGQSYDVASWRKYHPGGAETLDSFDNRDATDIFFAFHSKDAIGKLAKMSKKPTDMKGITVTKAAEAFRMFRKNLEAEGWFKRIWLIESLFIIAVFGCAIVGTMLSTSHPVIASCLIGLAM